MTWEEMSAAVKEARQAVRLSDSVLGGLAELLVGRLCASHVRWDTLDALKRELSHWNSHTHAWRTKA